VGSFSGLQPWLRPYAQYLVDLFPPGTFTVTSVFRSISDQAQLYARRARNPYPVAPPGKSKHNYGLAWDMTGDRAALKHAGAIWRSWGGGWWESDPIHFEVLG
jgi:hypothetical protein